MAVGSSFDQWQKDVFFSAAEEVQESADSLESIYRMWLRYRGDGFDSVIQGQFGMELHTALGTAKWQLEEFERAVNLSHQNCSSEEKRIARHKEFIAVLQSQVSHIEKALSDSLVKEGKQPLSWIQLDKEERDDLAVFLSAGSKNSKKEEESAEHYIGPVQVKTMSDSVKGFTETVTINKDSKYVVEVACREPLKNKVEVISQEDQSDGQRRTWSSQDMGTWKIVIADEVDTNKKMVESRMETPSRPSSLRGFLRSVESKAKSKWFRHSLPKAKSGEQLHLKQEISNCLDSKGFTRFTQGITRLSERSKTSFSSCGGDSKVSNLQQLVGRTVGVQRHIEGYSLRATIFLLLAIVLIVPFVLYST